MSPAVKKRLKWFFILLPWVLLVLAGWFLWWLDDWEGDLLTGRRQRVAMEMLYADPYSATEARIYLLSGEESRKTSERFPVGPDRAASVYGTAILRGPELRRFFDLWQSQSLLPHSGGFCHELILP